MYDNQRFGSDGFVRFMRTLAALAILIGLGGALVLTLRVTRDTVEPRAEFGSGYGPGVLLLEAADEIGPDPFTAPVAVDLGLDPSLIAFPPLDPESLERPHRRGSAADLLIAGRFGWELIDRRDQRGGRLPVSEIRALASEFLGFGAALTDLDDLNGDGFDDDGTFTLRAGDGSAVCVTPGSRRTLTDAQGHQIDAGDGAAAHGMTWTTGGPCGTPVGRREASTVRDGATPGVFGASRRGEVCDVGLLLSSLQANPPVADAWAAVRGIQTGEIGEFVGDLTPVVLLGDTVVTNFGWRSGQIIPRQSVLQRGTTVLVDGHGVPAARCLSGSPLRSAQALAAAPDVHGDGWPGFNRSFVVEVASADRRVGEFLLLDAQTGEPIRRAPGVTGALASLAGPVYVAES